MLSHYGVVKHYETLVAEFQTMPLVQLFEMASIKIADLKKQVSLAALVDGQRSLL